MHYIQYCSQFYPFIISVLLFFMYQFAYILFKVSPDADAAERSYIVLIHTHDTWHIVAAIDYRGVCTVETGGKLEAVFRGR